MARGDNTDIGPVRMDEASTRILFISMYRLSCMQRNTIQDSMVLCLLCITSFQ